MSAERDRYSSQALAAVLAALEVYESPDAKPEDVQAKAMEAALAATTYQEQSSPSNGDAAPLEVEMFVLDGEEAFIVAVRGRATIEDLQEIEAALQPSEDNYYQHGEGTYMVRPTYFEGQRSDYETTGHSWEIAPGWGADPNAVVFLGKERRKP